MILHGTQWCLIDKSFSSKNSKISCTYVEVSSSSLPTSRSWPKQNFCLASIGTNWPMIPHDTQWYLIDKIFFTRKLKDILYLRWGTPVLTSYIKILASKKFSFGLNWHQLAPWFSMVSHWQKFFHLRTQRYLVFTSRCARSHFLHQDLEDLDFKEIFNWSQLTPIDPNWLNDSQWCLIDQNLFTWKLGDTLYLGWSMLIFTSYVEILTSKKNFGWSQLVPIGSMILNDTQWNLIDKIFSS